MGKIIDITGEIYTGMWSYGSPFPQVSVKPLAEVDWVKYKIYAEVFEGLNSQSEPISKPLRTYWATSPIRLLMWR